MFSAWPWPRFCTIPWLYEIRMSVRRLLLIIGTEASTHITLWLEDMYLHGLFFPQISTDTADQLAVWRAHNGAVMDLHFSPCNKKLLSVGEDLHVSVRDCDAQMKLFLCDTCVCVDITFICTGIFSIFMQKIPRYLPDLSPRTRLIRGICRT